MRILILGGTEFVGRALAAAALERDWPVTVFHRGRHPAPAGVAELLGDRTEPDGLAALAEGEWDVVVDTWSAAPSAVRDAAELLAGRVGRYVYVSSRSVYAWPPAAGQAEDGPLVEGASPDADGSGGPDYPRDKRGGELAAIRAFGEEQTLLVRAGLIIGPWENIGRLPWWLNRMARGGPVLAPEPRELPLQYIDARDLAEWTLDAAEAGLSGPYNLVSPPGHTTTAELLTACLQTAGTDAELRWTPAQSIVDAGIEPWSDLPIWVPPGEMYDAMHTADVSKAVAAGLRCRPVGETVADTWAWLREAGAAPVREDRGTAGLDPDLERKVLS
ncbi:NAD-dependent epimerase/dehydratase family protein [Streptomyces sp. NPDC051907]|uniref:NAD-dependent epimerase/dehydratase family protein n=1 Tax=Streptomyces sp. NPDC051907 TaxID=3155284 RepID=UPI003412B9F6